MFADIIFANGDFAYFAGISFREFPILYIWRRFSLDVRCNMTLEWMHLDGPTVLHKSAYTCPL